jgi:hypothetical protein
MSDENPCGASREGARLAATTSRGLSDGILAAIVIGAACAMAAGMLAAYAAHPDDLWRGIGRDRNSHFFMGLEFALALRNFDLPWLLAGLEHARAWPPLHGLILAGVLLLGGIDHRLAIVPSLAGWVITAALVWFITRRLIADRVSGVFAAAVAVIFTMASPTFRLFASDAMLESLGAALTALSLWAYLAARADEDNAVRWRLLALVLTALFFFKSNYWGLVALSLAVTVALEHRDHLSKRVHELLARRSLNTLARAVLRDPLLLAFAGLALLSIYLYAWGPTNITVLGRQVKVSPPENLVTIAYAVLFVRAALAWHRHRTVIDSSLGTGGRAILYWHIAPVAISWLLPKRLPVLLMYVSQTNHLTLPGVSYNPLNAVEFYWNGFIYGLHLTPWLGMLAVALAAVGATQFRRLPPGGIVVFVLLVISAVGVVLNPTDITRYLLSWIFTVWIAAGLGAAALLDWSFQKRWTGSRLAAATICVVALVAANVWRTPPALAFAEPYADRTLSGPVDPDLVRPYLPQLAGAREILFVTTFGWCDALRWPVLEYCRCKIKMPDPFLGWATSREDARNLTAARIAETSADVMVVIGARHLAAEPPQIVSAAFDLMSGAFDAAAHQDRFALVATVPLPNFEGEATIWRRVDH